MALVTIASDTVTADVIGGTITRPLIGVWTADLTVDQVDGEGFAAGAKVTISSQDGYSLSGVIAPGRTGDYLDTVHVRVLGGAGGLPTVVQPRAFVQPGAFVRDVLNGLCGDSGETLSSTIDAGLLTTNLAAWSTKAEPMSYALLTLLGWISPTLSWRILADGTLWVGNETWPSASVTYDVLGQDPKEATLELGLQSPAIEPGTTVDGIGQISRVEITIAADSIRARVWTPVTDPDRGTNADMDALISQKTSHVDYYALYVFQVVAQAADLSTVDINPSSDRNKSLLGGMQRVAARYLTGIQVQVAPGATCLLGWDGGNPEAPFALILSGDTALSARILGNDPVITKTDITALINAITSATYVLATGPGVTGGTATALVFSPPANYGSTTVGAGR